MSKRKYPELERGDAIKYGKYLAERKRQEDQGIAFRGPALSPQGFRNAVVIERQIGTETGFSNRIVDQTRILPQSRVDKIVEGLNKSGDALRWQRVPGVRREHGRVVIDKNAIAANPEGFFNAIRRAAVKGIDPSLNEEERKKKTKEAIDEIFSPKEEAI